MNRGVLQNSPVQQMMAAGNPSWWPNINNLMRPPILSSHNQQPPLLSPPSSSSTTLPNFNNNNDNYDTNVFQTVYTMNMPIVAASPSSWHNDHNPSNHQEQHQQLHESWSQLFLGGVYLGEEGKKMEPPNWEEQIVRQQQASHHHHHHHPQIVDVKQESSVNSYNSNVYNDKEFQLAAAAAAAAKANWSHNHPQLNNIPVSSPQSCVTSFSNSSNNLLDFSSSVISTDNNLHSGNHPPTKDHAFECNSTGSGGAAKKAKVQQSSTQSTAFKVRKERLGDRITALHQLVSPFGKTDTASVLLEAIGYIRFLQSQIEALSLPYLNTGAGSKMQPHPIQGERKCIFPEDPGEDSYEEPKDLRSRGLCLVPVSCTLHVGSDNGADYWAPALGGGFR